MRRLIVSFLVVCLAIGLGCQKQSESSAQKAEQQNGTGSLAADRILARVHFKGFDHLASETNGTTLREIWNLPETAILRTMALEKLAPSLLNFFTNTNTTANADRAALVRPLLEDLLRSESVFELIERANRSPVWTLAVRLDETRKNLWRENLDKLILNQKTNGSPFLFAGKLTNGWVALAYDNTGTGAGMGSPLWRQVGTLPASVPSPHWFRADADWPHLTNFVSALSSVPLPRFDLSVFGKGDGLRTEGHLHYAKPLNLPLDPWLLPTNTIRDPLISFTTARSFGPWLKKQEWFQKLGLTSLPNQLVAWGQSDTPFQIQLAFPVDNASNALSRLATKWVPVINSNLVDSPLEPVQVHTNVAQMDLHFFFLIPFLRRAPEPDAEFLNAGIFPVVPGAKAPPPPPDLFEQLNRTNLVYYDWEITQVRLGQLRETLDVLGTLLTLPTMPTNSATRRWIEAAGPKLGNTITEITTTSPEELSLVRRSHVGLNGLELVALANWIESTNFPKIDLSVGFRAAPKSRRAEPSTAAPRPKP